MDIKKITRILRDNIKDDTIVKDILSSFSDISEQSLNEGRQNKRILGEPRKPMNITEWLHKDIKIKDLPDDLLLEAIIKLYGRPALLVKDGTFETPICQILAGKLNTHRKNIDNAIKSVGRIELENHTTLPYAGTGWVVSDGIIATKRHVAEVFSYNTGVSLTFRPSNKACL